MTRPKHCEACRTLFAPKGVGLTFVFCPMCILQCERVYQQIRQYLLDHPGTPATRIPYVLGVPAVFVHHLFRLGRFAPDLSRRTPVEKRPCAICRKALDPAEKVYCKPCNTVMEKRLHTRYQRSPIGQRDTQNTPAHVRFGRRERHHYGFGRSL